MRRIGTIGALAVSGLLTWAGTAGADAVTHWNNVTLQAVTANRAGPVGLLDIALVQAAVYDAVQSIERRFQPYQVQLNAEPGFSSSVAAARAAHDLLVSLYPTNLGFVASLDAEYASYLDDNDLSALDGGAGLGAQVAARYLAFYRAAGIPASSPGGTGAGVWRPTPPANAAGFAPWVASLTPFTLESASQFRAAPPPALTSSRYRRDYNEVKALGSSTGSARTLEQAALAAFYTDNFPVQCHRTVREIADAHLSHIADSARLLALTSLAMADAFITAWDSKYFYNLWRPITAIQEGDADGNWRTSGGAAWTPLLATPNYPDYTSGANNVTAATLQVLRLFFKTDKFTFTVRNLAANPPLTRQYARFSDAAADVEDVRVYQGIHFRFADEVARKQGEAVARYAFERFLRPVNERRTRR
jgi:hypothetical protein